MINIIIVYLRGGFHAITTKQELKELRNNIRENWPIFSQWN